MEIRGRTTTRPLLAMALGAASVWASLPGPAICGPPPGGSLEEILVTAVRQADTELAAKVATGLQRNPYIFADHVTVTAENGTVRVGGVVRDLADLYAILKLARQIAGAGRVVNEIDYQPAESEAD